MGLNPDQQRERATVREELSTVADAVLVEFAHRDKVIERLQAENRKLRTEVDGLLAKSRIDREQLPEHTAQLKRLEDHRRAYETAGVRARLRSLFTGKLEF